MKVTICPAAAPALPPTAMIIDKQAWEDMKGRVAAGEAFRLKTLHAERDEVIAAAVRDGKLSHARAGQWAAAWDTNPDGTREILASLPKNVIPVLDIGQPGGGMDDDEDLEREFPGLYPPVRSRG